MGLDLWRDISIVVLALQLFIMLAIPLALFYFLVRGMQAVHRKLPPLFRRVQDLSGKVRVGAERTGDRVAAPVIAGHRRASQATAVWQALTQRQRQS